MKTPPVPIARIESRVLLIRGHTVMIDADMAELQMKEARHILRSDGK